MNSKTFKITSKAGQDMGTYEGRTEAEALLACHRAAGYGPKIVWLSDASDSLVFCDDGQQYTAASYRALCGDVGDWTIEMVTA